MRRAYFLMRVSAGLVGAMYFATYWPLRYLIFDGVCPASEARWLFSFPEFAPLLLGFGFFNSLLVASGRGGAYFRIVHFALVGSLFRSNCGTDNYGDQIYAATCFLLIFLPDPKRLDPSPWLQRTVFLFLATLYWTPFFYRLDGVHWWNGTAVWVALADPTTSRIWTWLSYEPQKWPAWAYQAATYLSLAYEIGFPLLIWVRPLRNPLIVFGLIFHVAMAVLLDLGLFPLQMAVLLLACWSGRENESKIPGAPPGAKNRGSFLRGLKERWRRWLLSRKELDPLSEWEKQVSPK